MAATSDDGAPVGPITSSGTEAQLRAARFDALLEKKMAKCGCECLLNDRSITDADARAVARDLARHTHIAKVDLVGNFIGDDGAAALAALLRQPRASGVTDVDLYGNQVGPAGAAALADALRANPSFVVLDLRSNPVGAEGARALAAAKAARPEIAVYYDAMTAAGSGGVAGWLCPGVLGRCVAS